MPKVATDDDDDGDDDDDYDCDDDYEIDSAGCAHNFFVFMHLALRRTSLCSSAVQDKPLLHIFCAASPIVSASQEKQC